MVEPWLNHHVESSVFPWFFQGPHVVQIAKISPLGDLVRAFQLASGEVSLRFDWSFAKQRVKKASALAQHSGGVLHHL